MGMVVSFPDPNNPSADRLQYLARGSLKRKSLKRFAENSRCESSSGKVHAGLSKLPFCRVKV